MKTELAIEVDSLGVRYGTTVALDSISFSADRGSILAVLGPNGAGKTSLIRVLATQQRPTSGQVTVAGHDVVGQSRAVQRRIGVTGQYAALDDDLTPAENLRLAASLHGLAPRDAGEQISRLLDRLDLGDVASDRLGTLSGGTRRRVDLAASLVASPEIIFLDEPTTGLDPHGRQRLWQLIAELAGEARTVVLTTQYLEEADQLADDILVLDHGRIVASGTPRQLKASIGGQIIAATLTHPGDAARATHALEAHSSRVTTDRQAARVVAHANDADSALRMIAVLDQLDLPVQELAVTTPTLDDAFYALTSR